MSNENDTQGDAPSKASVLVRQGILVVVFSMVVVAGVYEYAYARPNFNSMALKMNDLANNSQAANMNAEHIQTQLEAKPNDTETFEKYSSMLERYSVRRGLPMASFDLYVWYKKGPRGDWQYAGHKPKKRPTDEELHGRTSRIQISTRTDLKIQMAGDAGSRPSSPYEIPTEKKQDSEASSEPSQMKQIGTNIETVNKDNKDKPEESTKSDSTSSKN